MPYENESSDLKCDLRKNRKKIKFNMLFLRLKFPGSLKKRIWDPVGSDTSMLTSRLFYIKFHFFHMSYENKSSDLNCDLRKNREKYNLICYFCV